MKKKIKLFFGISIVFLFASCNTNYYKAEDFSKIKKVDAHVHYDESGNNVLAEQAKSDIFYLIDINLDSEGIGNDSALLNLENISLIQKQVKPSYFDYLTTFTLKNWESPDWAEQTIKKLEASFQNGAIGVKLYKVIGMTYQDSAGNFIMIDDPRFDKVIRYIISQDKTILAHIGEPKNCWLPLHEMTVKGDSSYFAEDPIEHMFNYPEKPSYQTLMDARDRFVEKHPDMRFIGAHLGSLEWSVDELAKELDRFPNMAVDMAARIVHLQYQSVTNYQKVRDFVIKYQDRLLYATDLGYFSSDNPEELKKQIHKTWIDDWNYFTADEILTSNQFKGEFKGLKLPKDVIDKIYRTNAEKWYKLHELKN